MQELLEPANKCSIDIQKLHDKILNDISIEIRNILYNYADGMPVQDAIKLLRSPISYEEYKAMQKRMLTTTDAETRAYLIKLMNTRAYHARISRLEALQEAITTKCMELANGTLDYCDGLFSMTIKEGYNRFLFEQSKDLNLAFSFNKIPTRTIDAILTKPFAGDIYSNRITRNVNVYRKELTEVLTEGIMHGKETWKITKDLENVTQASKHVCDRLVRTETTHFANQGELEAYKEIKIEEYVYLATLDSRTSEKCQELDGKRFPVSEAKAGENLPPMHPYCRSTTMAYYGDDFLQNLKRRATDKDGNLITMDQFMTYEEWIEQQ